MKKKLPYDNCRSRFSSLNVKTFFALAFLAFGITGLAQVSGYTFSQASGAYAPISVSGTPGTLPGDSFDDATVSYTLPWTFNYGGTGYTQLVVSSNGFMTFGATIPTNNTGAAYSASDVSGAYLYGTSSNNGVAAFNTDMQEQTFATFTGARTTGSPTITGASSTANLQVGMRLTGTGIPAGAIITAIAGTTITISANATATSSAAITPRSSIIAGLLGTAPNQIMVIQYTALKRFNTAGTGDNISFQIRLNQANNVAANQTIQFVYGNVTTTRTTTIGAQVGLRTTTSDVVSRTSTTSWASTTAGTNTSIVRFNSTVFPASGLTFTWTPGAPCTPPTITSQPAAASAFAGNTATFSVATSAPSPTYQWQYSTTLGGTYSNVVNDTPVGITYANATSSTLSVITSGTVVAGSYFYRAVVTSTCSTNSSGAQLTATNYCTASATTNDEKISNVTFNTINNNSTGFGAGYQNFSGTSTTVQTNVTYNFSATLTPGYGSDQIIVFIDYNKNGVFTDAGETVYTSVVGGPYAQSITIPATATLGTTRMRVRLTDTSNLGTPNLTSCGTSTYGQVEDYSLNIVPQPACGGAPNAGTATISSSPLCAGQPVALSATNVTTDANITYLWQSSPNGSAWTDIAGANTVNYSVTAVVGVNYFRLSTTCANSSVTSYSNPVSYTAVSCGSANMPTTGNAVSPCGANMALYDNGGPSGNYTDGRDNYVVFQNSGSGVITINGTLDSESTFDFLGYYSGTGTGTLLFEYSGTGNIPTFTSTPGQTITVRFDSDSNTVLSGFALSVVYSGTCAPPTITNFTPTTICASGTAAQRTITITGTRYTGATAVQFNGTSAESFIVNSDTSITAVAPSTATTGNITVVVPGGTVNSATPLTINQNYDFYVDNDLDGFGVGSPVSFCAASANTPPAGYAVANGDCDDNQLQYFDGDGDGFGTTTKVACGVADNTDCNDAIVYYTDGDLDGFGSDTKVNCPTATTVTNTDDCDDAVVFYTDADGDGFGSDVKVACSSATTVTNTDDCDDTAVFYTDADGDGFGSDIKEACSSASTVSNTDDCDDAVVFYTDADGDGFGSDTKVACSSPTTVNNSDDCDDAAVFYTDADGDGFGSDTKVACSSATTVTNTDDCDDTTVRYADVDGDGFGSLVKVACGGVTNSTDCNDGNNQVNPGHAEVGYNLIDDDCDGSIDEGFPPKSTVITGTQCDTQLPAIDTQIYANAVAGAQGYQWRITTVSGPNLNQVQLLNTALRVMKLTQLGSYAYDTTYKVEVAVYFAGFLQPYTASDCTVSTPEALTKLSNCNQNLTAMSNVIYANSVPFATSYKFKITDPISPLNTQEIVRNVREFRMNMVTAFQVKFNKTYNVQVAVRNTDGTYMDYGDTCNVNTPVFPTTSVQDAQCDDYAPATMNTPIYADSYPGAIAYVFNLSTGLPAAGVEVTKSTRTFKLSDFTGLIAGATYNVTVRLVFNFSDAPGNYGKTCTIVVPGLSRMAAKTFNAVGYPNPFVDSFNIDLTTSAQEKVNVTVYDMTGRQLDSQSVQVSDMETLSIGDRYPAGVYNVIVTQGEETKTLRMIKR